MSFEKELQEFQKQVDGAKYDIRLKGEGTESTLQGETNAMGEIMVIAILISVFARERKMKPESYIKLVSDYMKMADMITADTKEELNVMQEIIKNGGKIDGWNS